AATTQPAPVVDTRPAAAEATFVQLTQAGSGTIADGGSESAFNDLFKLWNASYDGEEIDPCTQAADQGLECVVQRGSWGQLRAYNRPAILMLTDDGGGEHQVVLTQLDNEQATV